MTSVKHCFSLAFILVASPLASSFLVAMNQSPTSVVVESFGNRTSSSGLKMEKSTTMPTGAGGSIGVGIHQVRNKIFELAGLVGQLSSKFLQKVPLDPAFIPLQPANNSISVPVSTAEDEDAFSMSRPNVIQDEEISKTLAMVLLKLIDLAHILSLKVGTVVRQKMRLNELKYPAELCRGKAGKYTEYSAVTGITKDQGQSTLHMEDLQEEEETVQNFLESVDQLTQDIAEFATARQWTRYHKPRNILLALLGELGELAEIFQWLGDCTTIDVIKKEDMDKIGQEIADCTIYILRLSDVASIDLRVHANAVIAKNTL